MPALETLHFLSVVLSMQHLLVNMGLVVYILNCVHGLERFFYLKLYNTMILVNAGMGNTPLLEYGAGFYW